MWTCGAILGTSDGATAHRRARGIGTSSPRSGERTDAIASSLRSDWSQESGDGMSGPGMAGGPSSGAAATAEGAVLGGRRA